MARDIYVKANMKITYPPVLEQLFKALSDDTRRRILALLASGEVCVCNIHGALGLPQPTISRHLAYLRKSGLVAARRDGLWMHYRLQMPTDAGASEILKATLEAVGDLSAAGSDRKTLSGLVAIPLRVLNAAATDCCRR
jgi:ArsR family transcriptional regulator, arsenate/arsenite/antimonite-responsive transcriptional repressor